MTSSEVDVASDNAEVSPAAPAELIPINERLDQIHASGDFKCRKYPEAWNDGNETGLDELPVEKCPFKTQPEIDDWLRGWCESQVL